MSVDITKENKLDPKYHKMYRLEDDIFFKIN